MPVNDNLSWVYDQLTKSGADMGTIDDFEKAMSDENNRKWAYDYAGKQGIDLGSMDDFTNAIMPTQQQTYPQEVEDAYNDPKNAAPYFKDKSQLNKEFQNGNMTVGNDKPSFWERLFSAENLNAAGKAFNSHVASNAQTPYQEEPRQYVEDPDLKARQQQLNEAKAKASQMQQNVLPNVPNFSDKPAAPLFENKPTQQPRFDYRQADNNFVSPATKQNTMPTVADIDKFAEEEGKIQFTPKKVESDKDILDNAMGRFSLTEEGQALQAEADEASRQHLLQLTEEFSNTPEYKEITAVKPKNEQEQKEMEEKLNAAFDKLYGDEYSSFIAPYQQRINDALFNRYGASIADEQQKLQKAQIGDKVSSLTSEINDAMDEHRKKNRVNAGSGGNAMNALMASKQNVERNDPDMLKLRAADHLMEQTNEILDAVKNGDEGIISQFGRGFWDNLDARNFSFGVSDMVDNATLLSTLRKAEKGEKLTDAEEKLLEAQVTNMAVMGFYGSDLSRAYKAGQTTGVSLPYMLEFIANPISGSGNAIAKSLLNWGAKKFGAKIAERSVSKLAAGLFGQAAAAAGMVETSSAPRVASGAMERLAGNYEINLNDKGKPQVFKTGNMSDWEAVSRESRVVYAEDLSEMIFNAFKGFNPFEKVAMPEQVKNFMDMISKNGVAKFVNKISNSKTYRQIADRAQFHGWVEEPAEEVLDNLAEVAMGEMTLEQATSLDTNLDIIMGLAPTSLAFSMIGLGSLAHEKRQNRKKMESAFGKLNNEQKNRLAELQEMAADENNDFNATVKNFMEYTINDKSLTQEERRAELEYLYESVKANEIDKIDAERTPEQKVQDGVEEAEMDGAEAVEPADMNRIGVDLEVATQEMDNIFGATTRTMFDADPMAAAADVMNNPNYTAEEKQVALDYLNAKTAYNSMIGRIREDIGREVEESNAEIDNRTDADTGAVRPATLKNGNRQVYIMNGNVVMYEDGSGVDLGNSSKDVIVKDAETGKLEFVPASDIAGIEQPIPAEQLKEETAANIQQTKAQEEADKINGTLAFQQGDTYQAMGEDGTQVELTIISDNGDGSVNVGINGEAAAVPMAKETVQQMADRFKQQQAQKASIERRAATAVEEQAAEPVTDEAVEQAPVQEEVAPTAEETATEAAPEAVEEQEEPMPMTGEGENIQPDYGAATPQRTSRYIYDENGLDEKDADQLVKMKRKAAEKVLSDTKKAKPEFGDKGIGDNIVKLKQARAAWEQSVADAQRQVDYWNAVEQEHAMAVRQREEAANQAAQQPVVQEEAPVVEQAPTVQQEAVETPAAETQEQPVETAPAEAEVQPEQTVAEEDVQMREISEEPVDEKQAFRDKAREWEEKVGVPVNLIESIDGIKDDGLRKAIEKAHSKGKRVYGWFDPGTGEVYFFMPDIRTQSDIDKTYLHEVVAHKGLRQLLGTDAFNKLCDDVWASMPEEAKKKYWNYQGADKKEGKERERYAADEYIAALAENPKQDITTWEKIVAAIREALRELGIDVRMTNDDIAYMLDKSLNNLMSRAEENRKITTDSSGQMQNGQPIRFSVSSVLEGAGFEASDTDAEGNKTSLEDKDGNVIIRQGKKVFSAKNPITVKDIENDKNSTLNIMLDLALEAKTITKKKAAEMRRKYADIVNMYLEAGSAENGGFEGLSKKWMWLGDTVFKTVATNSDAQYSYSLDITRVCKKNEAVIRAISALQRQQGYGATPAQIMDIYESTHEAGYQVPCPVCYVFSRYLRNGKYASAAVNGMVKYGEHLQGGKDPWTVEQWQAELDRLTKAKKDSEKTVGDANEVISTIFNEIDKRGIRLLSKDASEEEKKQLRDEIVALDRQYRAALDVANQQSLTNWINSFAIHSVNNKMVMYDDARKPENMEEFRDNALDIRKVGETMRYYPAIQRLRKSGGAAAGKEITFESDNELGELVSGVGTSSPSSATNWFKAAADAKSDEERNAMMKEAKKRFANAVLYAHRQSLRGGQRMWSWSDNIESLAPDVAVNLMQLEMLGGALQSYSKQLEGVALVASMDGYVNGSLLGKDNGWQEVSDEQVEVVDGKTVLKDDIKETISEPTVDGRVDRERILAQKGSPIYEENGKKYVLIFDDVLGIDPYGREKDGKHLKGLFDLNSELDRAGNILVGMNDLHVRASMADDRIFFIIPWHASGQSVHILKSMLGILGTKLENFKPVDYTKMQEEKNYGKKVDGKYPKVPAKVVEIWESHKNEKDYRSGIGAIESGHDGGLSEGQMEYRRLRKAIFDGSIENSPEDLKKVKKDAFLSQVYAKVKANAGTMTSNDNDFVYPYEYWDESSTYDTADVNGERYVEYCRRLGIAPKFSGKWNNGNWSDEGNFIDDKGYWKLLVDRRMYDTKGNFQDLTPTNVDGFTTDMVDPSKTQEKYVSTQVADDKATQGIVDDVLKRESDRAALAGRELPTANYDMTMEEAVDAYNEVKEGIRFRITPEEDAEYMDAVNSGDMEKAADMVKAAAEKAMPDTEVVDDNGNPMVVYHNTDLNSWLNRENEGKPFHVFNAGRVEGTGFFNMAHFGTKEQAEKRTEYKVERNKLREELGLEPAYKVYQYAVYLNAKNLKRVKDFGGKEEAWWDAAVKAQEDGYDGLVYSNEHEGKGDSYAVFSPTQIKSAEPVTYDDEGNVIPLSERFNPENNDIRFRVNDDKTLMGVHNISETKLKKAIKNGGLANPSLAVIDTRNGMHQSYGEISLIPKSSLIDKRTGRNAGTYAGDAWTPSYPTVEKRMTDKGESQAWKDMREAMNGNDEDGIRSETNRVFNEYLQDDRSPDRLAYWFLKEKGMQPEIIRYDSGVSEEDKQLFKDHVGNARSFTELDEQGRDVVLRLMANAEGKTVEDMLATYQRIKENMQRKLVEDPKPMFTVTRERTIEQIENYGVITSNADNVMGRVRSAMSLDGKVNVADTILSAVTRMRDGHQKEFDNWLDGKEQKYGVEEYIFNGYTPSGKRKYVRNTLENVSKLMNKESERNAGNDTGFSPFRSILMDKYGSLAEIRRNKDKLKKGDDIKEEVDKMSDELFGIIKQLADMKELSSNPFTNVSYADARLQEAVATSDPIGHLNRVYGYNIPKDGEFAKELSDIIAKVVTTPVKYFETKFNRPVRLNEFAVAVVPENTSEDVVKALQDAGLDVRTYDGTEEGRTNATMEAVDDRDDIRFRVDEKETAMRDALADKLNEVGIETSVAPVYYSNAEKAVQDIKQEKATPQQWLAMIEKNGGLKAGEDKWTGISDWLKNSKAKSLTKQEVLDYIRKNSIIVNETNYVDGEKNAIISNVRDAYGDELADWFDKVFDVDFDGELYIANDAVAANMYEKYTGNYIDLDEDGELYEEDRDDIMEWASQYFRETIDNGKVKPINFTRNKYTTYGLDNKREIALTVPTIERWNESDEIHFGDAGEGRAVAWVRFGETTDKDGNRVLVIDEIQSKRHQEGRESGYKSELASSPKGRWVEAVKSSDSFSKEMRQKYGDNYLLDQLTEEERKRHEELVKELNEASNYQDEKLYNIPDAPFEKNWHELAMKRMLRYAAENGYDKIAWTKGEQQADRYNISKVISSISRNDTKKAKDAGVRVFALDINGNREKIFVNEDGTIRTTTMFLNDGAGKSLSEFVGKELANKMMSMEDGDVLDEDNMKVGGEGMKGFYDEMLPRFMNKYGKKWGVKVGEVDLPNLEQAGQKMWSVDVTPEMKESVMQGQPMFHRTTDGRAYGYTQDGKIYIDPRIATSETPIHEYAHLWAEALRRGNAEEWSNVVNLMKGTSIWNDVANNYPELNTDDLLAEEVLAHYSGSRGAARLRKAQEDAMNNANGVFEKAEVASAFDSVRRALNRFWKAVADFLNIHYTSADEVADRVLNDLLSGVNPNEVASIDGDAEVRFRVIDDQETIDRLESEPQETGYRNVVLNEDGTLGSPMAGKLGGKNGRKATSSFEMNRWEMAEENPDIANENGKVDLIKPNGKPVSGVDYNPYIHIRPTMVNTQFKEAWKRPELVYVKTAYPASELNGEYKAEKAKLSVGRHPWNGGELILSRYDKPVEIMSWEEVADDWMNEFDGKGIHFDIIPPKLLPILAERGAEILPPHKGAGKACEDAYNAFKAQQEQSGDIRFSIRRGENSGYTQREDGSSISVRANAAEEDGKFTKGKFRQVYGISAKVFDILRKLGLILSREWHHTGLSFNESDYYEWRDHNQAGYENGVPEEGSLGDTYNKNKKEIDALAKEMDSAEYQYKPLEREQYVMPFEDYVRQNTPNWEGLLSDEERNAYRNEQDRISGLRDSGVSSYERREMHREVEDEYKAKAYGRVDRDAIRQDYERDYGDAIRHNENIDDRNAATREYNAKTNGKESILVKIGRLMGLSENDAVGRAYSDARDAANRRRADEIGKIDKEIESLRNEAKDKQQKYLQKALNEGKAEGFTRETSEPEMSVITKEEMHGRYGWFAASPSYRLPVYYSGYKFKDTRSFNHYNKLAHINDEQIEEKEQQKLNGYEGDIRFSISDDVSSEINGKEYNAGVKTFDEAITEGLAELVRKNKDAVQTRADVLHRVNNQLRDLIDRLTSREAAERDTPTPRLQVPGSVRSAAAAQRAFDKSTVDEIVRLTRMLLSKGFIGELPAYEVKRLMGYVNNAVGRKDIIKQAKLVVDLLLKHQLDDAAKALEKQLSVRGSKVGSKGVEVQGRLDVAGQKALKAFKEYFDKDAETIQRRIEDCMNRMSEEGPAGADAAAEYQGLMMAKRYNEDIKQSEQEEFNLKKEIEDENRKMKEGDPDAMSKEEFEEWREAAWEAIRKNRMDRLDAYVGMLRDFGGALRMSVEKAKAFREEEQSRVRKIYHFANSDMQGVPSDEHSKVNFMQRLSNAPVFRFLLSPMISFDSMLRFFGRKSPDGRGYLWNHFMSEWVRRNDEEWKNLKKGHDQLDAKVREIFGDGVKRWSDLFTMERGMQKVPVEFWDGGQKKSHELTQGNMLYIYMVNKMDDGKMKLRRMGISEEDVDRITEILDPRFIQLADWIQDVFLKEKRIRYNEVHERMFGAPMASIDNYFPLVINSRSRGAEVDVALQESDKKPATITGNIIKRVKNSTALDITNVDAFDLVLAHLQQMEHWAAFAELNRDMNTLLSYRHFRNQVMNMVSAQYGSGKKLLDNFKDACAIAGGAYTPKIGQDSLDKHIVNIAKGVTAAKIAFRLFTALKQLLSYPAYFSEASVAELAKSTLNPKGIAESWNWAIEKLPGFAERWQSRKAGDNRLDDTELDYAFWKNKIVETASRWGMSPNAFVDGLTVTMGAKAIYETKKKQYIKDGYDDARAEELALRDASVAYNETQQSSGKAYMSPVQLDRTALSVALTVFRNSSMGYQRRLLNSLRNLSRMANPNWAVESEEFTEKQLRRDGLFDAIKERLINEGMDEEKATAEADMAVHEAAERVYNRALTRSAVDVVIFGFIMQFAWNLGSYMPYLIGGDDDDKKKEMLEDAALHALAGGVEGMAGGSVISEIYNKVRKGDNMSGYNINPLPLMSDIQNTLTKVQSDRLYTINNAVNILMQSLVGVNPETITDIVLAFDDAAGGNLDGLHEFAFLMMRLANFPQSQLDELYIDELDLKGKDAVQKNPVELAKRYAEYKAKRNAPLLYWMYSDAEKDKLQQKFIKRFEEKKKERVLMGGDPEVMSVIDGYKESDAYTKTQEALDSIAAMPKDERKEQRDSLYETEEGAMHRAVTKAETKINSFAKKGNTKAVEYLRSEMARMIEGKISVEDFEEELKGFSE